LSNVKTLTYRDVVQKSIIDGAFKVHEVAKAAYGSKAGNVLIENKYGTPMLSRDGVTNISQVVLEDPNENMAAQFIIQASRKSDQKVGDGTTAVAILSYHLLRQAQKLATEYNPMEVVEMLEDAAIKATAHVDSLKRKVRSRLLRKVAAISAGSQAVGDLIADSIETVGLDGGVLVEEHAGIGISNEVVNGFYFRKGFTHAYFVNDQTSLKATYNDAAIVITEKRLSTATDVAPILSKLMKSGIKEVVFVGEVLEEALQVLALNKRDGKVMSTVVEPPVYAGGATLFLEDLAILTGGTVYTAGSSGDDFRLEMLGTAEKIVIDEFSTTILGGEGDAEAISTRVDILRQQLADSDHPVTTAAVRDRLSKLTGKVVIIRVGSALEIDRGYQKLRVNDAVAATQAAIRDGIVPGGGVTLATVQGTRFDDAFKQPFLQLAENAGQNQMALLAKIDTKTPWMGFNHNRKTTEPVNMLKEGVIDPSLVIKETIINATTVAANLVTVGLGMTYTDRDEIQ
jgi:chaperonin GroEL